MQIHVDIDNGLLGKQLEGQLTMINGISAAIYPHARPTATSAANPSLTVTVTPGESNVTEGDKSKNSVDVNIKTQKYEATSTLTREQGFDRLEQRLQKKAISTVIDVKPNSSSLVKSLAFASAINNSDLDAGAARETAVDLYTTKLAYKSAQSFMNYNNQNQPYQTQPKNDSYSPASEVKDAANLYYKSQLVFSTIDRMGQKLDDYT